MNEWSTYPWRNLLMLFSHSRASNKNWAADSSRVYSPGKKKSDVAISYSQVKDRCTYSNSSHTSKQMAVNNSAWKLGIPFFKAT